MAWFNASREDPAQADDRVAASLAHLRRQEFRARGFSFLPRQPVRSILTGRHGSRLRGRGLNFEELRHYRPGDDIRTLDWKVTNRTGKPHVRVYTEERERTILLLVDQRINMFFGSQRAMKSAVAAEVAALAAWRTLAVGDRLGGLVFDDRQLFSLTPRRSREAVIELLGRLATCNRALRAGQRSTPGQLNVALDAAARRLSHDALVVYIGDGHGWDDHSTEVLKTLARHNDVIGINVFDPAERDLAPVDDLVVSDGALQIAVRGSQARLRDSFREQAAAQVQRMREDLMRLGLPLLEINTVDDPLDQLLRALGGTRGATPTGRGGAPA
jgi:uncharacterized protein (DUF58 family)